MRSWVWILLLAVAMGAAKAQDRSAWRLHVETPEVLGYTIGDLIEHRARLVLDAPYRLDESSLPEARRLSSWLELRDVALHVDRGFGSITYDIELTYQIFNTASAVRGIATPPVSLTVVDGEGTFPVIIPAWGFSVLPVAAAEEVPPGTLPSLRPSRAPPPVDLRPYELRITLLSVALLVGFAYLLYLNGTVPFLRRSNGPFARAHRRLKRLKHRPFEDPVRREAYRHLHAAFNETAGHVVFAHDLEAFFAEQPRFRVVRETVESFYDESRRMFFVGEEQGGAGVASMAPLVRLARRFRDAERGLT